MSTQRSESLFQPEGRPEKAGAPEGGSAEFADARGRLSCRLGVVRDPARGSRSLILTLQNGVVFTSIHLTPGQVRRLAQMVEPVTPPPTGETPDRLTQEPASAPAPAGEPDQGTCCRECGGAIDINRAVVYLGGEGYIHPLCLQYRGTKLNNADFRAENDALRAEVARLTSALATRQLRAEAQPSVPVPPESEAPAPCPWCGAVATILYDDDWHDVWVECGDQDCRGPSAKSRKEAIAAWNRIAARPLTGETPKDPRGCP